MTDKQRFDGFVTGLEKLSAKYGVVLQVTGGVVIYDEGEIKSVRYDRDYTSGDLWPDKVECTPDEDETPSMSM